MKVVVGQFLIVAAYSFSFFYYSIWIHPTQGGTATLRHGVTRKERSQR